MYGLKVPSSVIGMTGVPSVAWMRWVLSETAVPCSSIAPRSHRLRIPAWHDGHEPHDGMNDSTTWSPGSRPSTPGPTSVTIPAPSWPPSTGKPAIGMSPVTR